MKLFHFHGNMKKGFGRIQSIDYKQKKKLVICKRNVMNQGKIGKKLKLNRNHQGIAI